MSQTLPHPTAGDPSDPDAIRPFTFQVTDEELADLRRRVEATRWPDRETDPTAGRAVGHDPGTRPLLGDRLRLASIRKRASRRYPTS